MGLPRGYRFRPEPSELVEYLQDKDEGRPDACQGVINDGIDVYGCSPEQLLLGDLILHDDGRSFFFTPIRYRKANCRDRSTPGGHWKSKNKETQILSGEGRPVGFVQDLWYFDGKTTTRWRMKEYTLGDRPPKTALCVIYCSQNKRKDRIQGNEGRMKSLKVEEAIDSESKDTRLHHQSNDSSSWEKAIEDERRQYPISIAEKTGESHDGNFFIAWDLGAAGAPKFSKPEERVGPSEEEGGFFSSKNHEVCIAMESSHVPSTPATSAGNLIGGDWYTGCNSWTRVNPESMTCQDNMEPLNPDASFPNSPSDHAVAPSNEGRLAKAAAYPDGPTLEGFPTLDSDEIIDSDEIMKLFELP